MNKKFKAKNAKKIVLKFFVIFLVSILAYTVTTLLLRQFFPAKIVTIDSALVNTASEINKTLPMTLDSETTLDNLTAMPNKTMRYNLTLFNMDSTEYDAEQIKALVTEPLKNRAKTNPDVKWFRDNNISLSYYYYDKNSKFFFEIKIAAGEY